MIITLPWFNRVLNPNDKSHWRVKANARIKQKSDAIYLARESGKPPVMDIYPLEITFHPPDKRQRDIDNCLSACKGALDGIAIAWKVNDKQFRFVNLDFGDVIKNGAIIITIR